MINIAILGYGIVGSGVVEVLNLNKKLIDERAREEINLKYVLDLRDFKGEPIEKYITHNFDDILNDESIDIVVEVMGGTNPSYEYAKKCLEKNKSVITSNKALVAKHGAELLLIAKNNEVNFLFEASVGGGIPVIRNIKQALTADYISEIEGILNGTTNYILTKMTKSKIDFEICLKEAQEKGYAEKDPTDDVCGYDTCRKLAILLSLITKKTVNYEDIYTEGITKITKEDIDFCSYVGGVIKLIAKAKQTEDGIIARVAPTIITETNPLENVSGVFNSVLLTGNAFNKVMLYGRGAGKLPTSSAVIGDIIDAIRHMGKNIGYFWSEEKQKVLPVEQFVVKRFIRFVYSDKNKAIESINKIFGNREYIEIENYKDQMAFVTDELNENEIEKQISFFSKEQSVIEIKSKIIIEC